MERDSLEHIFFLDVVFWDKIGIEKGDQSGGLNIRDAGYHWELLVIIESMNDQNGNIIFKEQ